MNFLPPARSSSGAACLRRSVLLVFLVCCWSFAAANLARAQGVQPQPTAASTPVAVPTAAPSATPIDSPTPLPTATPVLGGSPTITIVPGLPNLADIEAYNLARIPQINISLAPTAPGSLSGTSATSAGASTSLQFSAKGGVPPSVTLVPASGGSSKTSRASAANTATSQPVATVVLLYPGVTTNQLVWVQPLRGGTLTATDGAGHTYDGSSGLFLTLGAGGSITFAYQAPNQSGTYQVLTRFSNVKTTLTFRVPDTTP